MSEAVGAVEELRPVLGEIWDLNHAAAVLNWDQETQMPPGGVEGRAQALSTVGRMAHERLTSGEVGRLLERLEQSLDGEPPDSFARALATVLRRDWDEARRIPADLVAEQAAAAARAKPLWLRARSESDWRIFAPAMRTTVELARRQAEHLSTGGELYDALISVDDPGVTAAQMRAILAEMRAAIVPLVRSISERPGAVEDRFLRRDYDENAQVAFALTVVRQLGYDLSRGRQDISAHPFCTSFGRGDVRITTRVERRWLPGCLFGSIHESGHAMYSQGIAPELERTPLGTGASSGVHESQSRLWENLVGRSRPFWRGMFAELQRAFPDQLDDVDDESFYRGVNRVEPSYIRVEADEVTYNLHILIRFELEVALLDGSLAVEDVPAAWNAKISEYLGLPAPSDAQGALQDIHWTFPTLGTFVGYTLGNLISAQLMETIRDDLPQLDSDLEAREFGPLCRWLNERVHQHGRMYTPNQLVERVTGRPLSGRPWVEYVRGKFGEIYG